MGKENSVNIHSSLRRVKSEQDLRNLAKLKKKSVDIDDNILREILHNAFILYGKMIAEEANQKVTRELLLKASVYEALNAFIKASKPEEIEARRAIVTIFLKIAETYFFDFFIKPQKYPSFYKQIQEAEAGPAKREVCVAFIKNKISLENQPVDEKIKQFMSVYRAVLKGAGKKDHEQRLIKEIDSIKIATDGQDDATIEKEIFSAIQRYVDKNPNSLAGFAWSHSQDFHSGIITSEELFKQVYEESFQRSGFFSLSKISGQTVFFKSSLHKALEGKNLFNLFESNKPGSAKTRTGQVYYELTKMDSFMK